MMNDNVIEINEEKISSELGSAYNQSTRANGDASEEKDLIPHRHIVRWYLTKEDDVEPPSESILNAKNATGPTPPPPISFKRRYPLPDDRIFDGTKFMLHGYIIPNKNNDDKNKKEIPIVLQHLIHWEVDTSTKHRGIWVRTKVAWYYLKDACSMIVPRIYSNDNNKVNNATSALSQDPNLPSQEKLHLPLRAKLGLLSNLIDVFSEGKDGKLHYYAPLHAEVTIEESYKMLSFDTVLIETKYKDIKPPLNDEPFDLLLLKQKGVAVFIREHLIDFHASLSDNSTFIKSLTSLIQQPNYVIVQSPWLDGDYEQSAEKAERRGRRERWCEPLSTIDEAKPNRLIELNIGHGITNGETNASIEEMKKAVENTADKMVNGDKNAIFVMTEKTCFEQDMMIEAISNISEYLIPKPTDQMKKEADFGKFSLDESKLEEFFQNYVLNPSVISLELMLLVVKVISQSSDKVMKSMFKVKKMDKTALHTGTVVFKFWFSYVFGVMEKRRHRFSRIKPKLGEIRPEELVASAILDLITKFHVIKTYKQITTLKNKYSVDWVRVVYLSSAYVNAHGISELIASSKLAVERLDKMLGENGPTKQGIIISNSIKNEVKKPDTKVVSSSSKEDDASRLRIAKMIEESKKRNKLQHERAASKPKVPVSTIVEKESVVNQKSSQSSVTKAVSNSTTSLGNSSTTTSNIREEKLQVNDLSRKRAEQNFKKPSPQRINGNSTINSSTNRSTQQRNDTKYKDSQPSRPVSNDDRISTKKEDGLSGLPFGNSWKQVMTSNDTSSKSREVNTNLRTSSTSNANNHKPTDDDERLTNKGVDGLSGLLYGNSWKSTTFETLQQNSTSSKRNLEDSISGSDDKRRKLGGNSYFVPPNKSKTIVAQPSHINNQPYIGNVRDLGGESNQGRGRGRGRDMNKPAWMTRQESNVSSNSTQTFQTKNNAPSSHSNHSKNGTTTPQVNPVRCVSVDTNSGQSLNGQTSRSLGRGRGRGKEMNLPAWMTRKDPQPPSSSNQVQTSSTANTTNSVPKTQNLDQRFGNNTIAGAGRGRGRGKDVNKPAWLTRQENNNYTTTETNPVTTNQQQQLNRNKPAVMNNIDNSRGSTLQACSRSIGRGRGRGKDINKPAWMTRHENTNAMAPNPVTTHNEQDGGKSKSSYMSNMQSKTFDSKRDGDKSNNSYISNVQSKTFEAGRGRGRGRGKDINKPAWMTMQQTNNSSNATSGQPDHSRQKVVENQSSHNQRNGGVGRGKNVNLPAWMTKGNESSQNDSRSGQSDQRDRQSSWTPPSRGAPSYKSNNRRQW